MEKKLISICMICRRVKLDDGTWILDPPGTEHPDRNLSHGYCPDCFREKYGDEDSSVEMFHTFNGITTKCGPVDFSGVTQSPEEIRDIINEAIDNGETK